MKYPENILEVGSLLPDYMGFIFWEKSARYFDGEILNLPKSIKKVGVFVNATSEEILEKIEKYDLQAVQLHGSESVKFCESLKNILPKLIDIIKVFSILDTFDFAELKPFEDVCDFFLFDTKGKLPGGNGTTFDWKVLKNYTSTKVPILLPNIIFLRFPFLFMSKTIMGKLFSLHNVNAVISITSSPFE